MQEECIGLRVGGQMNILYAMWDDTGSFVEGADDEERVEGMLEVFL